MRALADSNVLIALAVSDHVHHRQAHAWFEEWDGELATCPITEGALVRFLVREGLAATGAVAVLEALRAQPWHRFVTDSIPIDAPMVSGVIGHRQVTDAYLTALSRTECDALVTLDRGLAALHGDGVILIDEP